MTDSNATFRGDYPDYDALTAQLRAWADAHPDHVRLRSLTQTPEGRDLWVLSVGANPDGNGPAVWVDGNMHASELAGSSVALAVAEAAIALHTGDGTVPGDLPAPVLAAARGATFHIAPRLSPDGAEAVLKTGRYVRSVPRDRRDRGRAPHWRLKDVDGDGLALAMRRIDPAGDFVESARVPGLMQARRIDDHGPFYRIYPEGVIDGFDGHTIPSPEYLADNTPDLNRNFPYSWTPEEEQPGAGPLPLSERESRAVAEFATEHPEIFAWLNLHTFGGVVIRPLGAAPDSAMNAWDLACYREIGEWASALTGYPMVSGHEEFTYEPGKPLRGDMMDFAYHQRGCFAMACELWDLFARLDIERHKPFVEHYSHLTAEELERLAIWDREYNAGRIQRPWRACEHPQLGAVEVGGWDPRVGVFNPPYEELPALCDAVATLWVRVAAMAARPVIDGLRAVPVGAGVHRVEAIIRNEGYLPTQGLPSSYVLTWNHPLSADLEPGEGVRLVDADPHRHVGHLAGWGKGLFGPGGSLFYRVSEGNGSERRLHWFVAGEGAVTIRVSGPRVGTLERTLAISRPDQGKTT